MNRQHHSAETPVIVDSVAPFRQEGFCGRDEVRSVSVRKIFLTVFSQDAGSDSDMSDCSVVSDSHDIGDGPVCYFRLRALFFRLQLSSLDPSRL